MKKCLAAIKISVLCLFLFLIVASAHPGKTDSSGGHYDHSSGEYHYHHGYPAHSHYDIDGDGNIDCPYDFKDNTNHNNNFTDKNKKEVSFGDIILKISITLLKSVIAFFFAGGIAAIVLALLSKLPKTGNVFSNDRASIIATILIFVVFLITIIKDTF